MKTILILSIVLTTFFEASAHKENDKTVQDSTNLAIATQYLDEKLGKEYVKAHLRYAGQYESVLSMVTFEIVPQQPIKKNMIIVSLDGKEVESKYNSKISMSDIELYNQGKEAPNIFFNKAHALAQAKNLKLKKGIKPWEVEMSGVAGEIFWIVKSYAKEYHEPMWSASGTHVKVDIRTGKALTGNWRAVE
ncbi:hypothetical protein [Hymenobacter sp. BT190]|uniref:hypothetical protein n=1 Tax=Hymenobacter sp. BT190 TaxID=2763505 RepID=UPI0016514FBE|nr:hypothetical protein [Hymenobacter sp. BT190]MBC6698775.1 hypothetical protein [Hymenobacter sp. BT190]